MISAEEDAALAAGVAALHEELARDRAPAVERLRAREEEWARRVLGLAPRARASGETRLVAGVRELVEAGVAAEVARRAERHLAAAEQWQWEIGTWATGAGEGLSSMFEVRSLQLARAWLLAAGAAEDASLVEQARQLARAVADDPNDVAAPHRKAIAALFKRLDG